MLRDIGLVVTRIFPEVHHVERQCHAHDDVEDEEAVEVHERAQGEQAVGVDGQAVGRERNHGAQPVDASAGADHARRLLGVERVHLAQQQNGDDSVGELVGERLEPEQVAEAAAVKPLQALVDGGIGHDAHRHPLVDAQLAPQADAFGHEDDAQHVEQIRHGEEQEQGHQDGPRGVGRRAERSTLTHGCGVDVVGAAAVVGCAMMTAMRATGMVTKRVPPCLTVGHERVSPPPSAGESCRSWL